MSFLVLGVDDESDVEDLFRQQFRHDLRAGRFTMDFAQSGDGALQRISDAAGVSLILILSDINMPAVDREPDHGHRRLLRTHRERPSDWGAVYKRKEFAQQHG